MIAGAVGRAFSKACAAVVAALVLLVFAPFFVAVVVVVFRRFLAGGFSAGGPSASAGTTSTGSDDDAFFEGDGFLEDRLVFRFGLAAAFADFDVVPPSGSVDAAFVMVPMDSVAVVVDCKVLLAS